MNRWMLLIATIAAILLIIAASTPSSAQERTVPRAQLMAQTYARQHNGNWSCQQRGHSCLVTAPTLRIYTTQRGPNVYVRRYTWTPWQGWTVESWWM